MPDANLLEANPNYVAPAKGRGDTVEFVDEWYTDNSPDWELMTDLVGPTHALLKKAGSYIPKAPAEPQKKFEFRLKLAEFTNFTRRTLKGLVGMVYRTPPELGDDVNELLKKIAEDIDNKGTHLDVWGQQKFAATLAKGRGGILVEFPDAQPKDSEEEQKMGVRPYWSFYCAENIRQIKWYNDKGRMRKRLVVLREVIKKEDGMFASRSETQYRVLALDPVKNEVTWTLYVQTGEGKNITYAPGPKGVYLNQTDIPFAFCELDEGNVPLADLARMNLQHWRVRGDQRYGLFYAQVAQFVLSGVPDDYTLKMAGDVAWSLPQGATASILETTGKSLEVGTTELEAIKTEMATVGLSFLQPETRAAETATSKRIDKAEQDSALASFARAWQDCLEESLHYTAAFFKQEDGGSIRVNMEFEHLTLDGDKARLYNEMVVAENLSRATFWEILMSRGELPETFDPEEEKKRIEEEKKERQDAMPIDPLMDPAGDPLNLDPNAKKDTIPPDPKTKDNPVAPEGDHAVV